MSAKLQKYHFSISQFLHACITLVDLIGRSHWYGKDDYIAYLLAVAAGGKASWEISTKLRRSEVD